MKKIILIMALICTVFLCGCADSTKPVENVKTAEQDVAENNLSPSQKSLAEFRKVISEKNALCGVAFLGTTPDDFGELSEYLKEQSYYDDFLFLDDLTEEDFVSEEGQELYVVIPRDESITVTVSQYVIDLSEDYWEGVGEELLKSEDGKPVLVRGNISDIMSNLHITVVQDGSEQMVEYRPCLSLRDGMISRPPMQICDLTPYSEMDISTVADSEACGNWMATAEDGEGNERTLLLSLGKDGRAEYSYGDSASETIEMFKGNWYDDGGMLSLELTGGPAETEGAYEMYSSFEYELSEGNLILTHSDGGSLLYDTYGMKFVFEPAE